MTILDARLAGANFDMGDGTLVNYESEYSFSATSYAWNTSASSSSTPANRVFTEGTGIGVGPNFYPFAGSISSLKIDIAQDGDPGTNAGIDALITTATPVALTDLVSPAGTDPQAAADKFWETLLSGDDEILAPDQGRGFMFGDFLQILSDSVTIEEKTGGDDVISAAPVAGDNVFGSIGGGRAVPRALIGDAGWLQGFVDINNIAYAASLQGGNDRITLSGRPAYSLIGDAYSVGPVAFVDGGDDVLLSDAVPSSYALSPTPLLAGDAALNDGSVVGGKDIITGSNNAFLDEMLVGDVWRQTGGTTGGIDTIKGRAGHDFIAGDVMMMGGALTGGVDTLRGGEDSDIIAGDALQFGNDGPFGNLDVTGPVHASLIGAGDRLYGEAGNDILAGDIFAFGSLTADSTIRGGNDLIDGGAGDDEIHGDFGNADGVVVPAGFFDLGGADRLYGGDGADMIYGDAGNDLLDGGAGADTLRGGTGADTYYVDDAGDVVDETGGAGIDRVVTARSFNLGSASQVDGDVENLTQTGTANVSGVGNALANIIVGNGASNALSGAAGNDKLSGAAGTDTLTGGSGADQLTGGTGADTFRYLSLNDSTVAAMGRDRLSDFDHTEADRIDLQAIDARTNVAGDQAFSFIGAAAFSHISGQLRAEVVGASTFVYGDVNGDATADFAIVLSGAMTLQAGDFIR